MSRKAAAWFAIGIAALGFGWGVSLVGSPVTSISLPWLPDYGIQFAFRLDSYSLLFWLLITGIGVLVLDYADKYMGEKPAGRLLGWLIAFMASMLAVVSADDAITLFVAWEATSLSSFALISIKFTDEKSRKSATQALLVTGMGGLFLFGGLLWAGVENNTFQLSQISSLSGLALVLITIGCFAKSAQWPLHFWLPNAMAAPTPVSSYLHSATMVKAGVYLLGRLSPVMGFQPVIHWFGLITAFWGATLALGERDLKKILAWSTVAALGQMVALVGLGTETAAKAAVLLIFAHSLYKAALFMGAGLIEKATGTRDMTQVGGLAKPLRPLAIAFAFAGLSMAGFPPLIGFVAKEAALEAFSGLSLAVFVASSALGCVVAWNVTYLPFWRGEAPETVQSLKLTEWGGIGLLSGLSLAFGIAIPLIGGALLGPAASSLSGSEIAKKFSLWHGFNFALLFSVLVLVVGFLLATQSLWIRTTIEGVRKRLTPSTGWETFAKNGLKAILTSGWDFSRVVIKTSFRQHLELYFVAFLGLGLLIFLLKGFPIAFWHGPTPTPIDVALAVFASLAAIAALFVPSRLGTVTLLGIVGVSITLTYVKFSAPDLGLTQVLVETLTVVLFVLVFAYLPRFTSISTKSQKVKDLALALGFGSMMGALMLGVFTFGKESTISNFFAEQSVPGAKGSNVVNTIIVDFRALDTFGEITVLAVAAMGVHALVRLRLQSQGRTG
ncbi:MAG: DUF4040 domain-containing protein [Fimbriimonadaceae bacterium]|nr:DUF4040 domain-containing protein [Fimbriimonadaceae bacterium]